MRALYRSRGISKAAVAKKLLSIAVCVILAVVLIMLAGSKTEGPSKMYSIGGGPASSISLEKDRFSDEAQQGLATLACVLALMALIDAVLLGLYKISWTEIYSDSIRANYMGKTVSYYIADITQISEMAGHLIISGSGGRIGLITQNPKRVHKLLEDLLMQQ